jgi:transposase
MSWTQEEYNRIKHLLPVHRGNVEIDNFTFLQALAYINKHGCCWRGLPTNFGKWFTIYKRFRRWTEQGVFKRIEEYLMTQSVKHKGVTELAIDSTYIKVHPHGMGAPKKRGTNPLAKAGQATQRKST